MNRKIHLLPAVLLLGSVGLLAGCQGPGEVTSHSHEVVISDQSRITTLGFDANDYRSIAQKIYNSLATSANIEPGKVVAMGPAVVGADQNIQFDPVTMHEEIATLAQRGGIFSVSEAIRGTKNVSTEEEADQFVEKFRQQVQQLAAAQSQIDNPEDYARYGQLAKINYLLVFELSTQSQVQGKLTEVTYRFNCRLVGTQTGLRKWVDQITYTKSYER